MIADLKPYPEYKASGLPWLGQVPGHWETRRMKFLFEERVQKGFPDEPLLAATQSKGVVRKKDYGARTVTAMKDLHLLKLVVEGDFVISLRSFQGGIEVTHARGIISPAYTILTPRHEAIRSYYTRFFKSPDFISSLTLFVTGIREGQNIDYERLSRTYLPLPPVEEQQAIGVFLDWANGRLERAIRAKLKVIALLNEQKQAIIHRAVTRGLDPSVPLKPSGIPWLGDIPRHWEVRRLKFVASRIVDCLHATPRYSDSGSHPAIRTADVSPGVVHLAGAKRISSTEYVRWTARLAPREDDILYSREGERFGIAACVPASVKLCISQRMMVFRIGDDDCSTFVMRVLNSQPTYGQALQDVMGATAPHVNISTIRNYFLALPNKQEQEAIIAHVDSETCPIDIAISRLEREVDLLREYRTRLVADVVTGKLDVREAAGRLPEDTALDNGDSDPDLDAELADEAAEA
ncbi:MAG: restriction endonuclease subunit S [Candidatus Competibacter sp.]|nr:restriction endonuclease subunit S [Candidatus Competibacter sp.]